MKVVDFLARLKVLGIRVQLSGENELKISGEKQYLTPGIISELKEQKEEIIHFFKKNIQPRFPVARVLPVEKKEYYPLSSAQERIYLIQQSMGDTSVYNLPMIMNIEGSVEEEKIQQCICKLFERYESLKTSFVMVDEKTVQRIHWEMKFRVENWSASQQSIHEIIKNFIRPFDLASVPLMRAGLIKFSNKKYILIVDMHHIITDGASIDLLKNEFISIYSGKSLLPLKLQYKDYSDWHHREKTKEYFKSQESYWLKEFSSEIPTLNLTGDYIRPAVQSFEGDTIYFELTASETNALKDIALSVEGTLFMALLSVFNIFLAAIGNQDDIIVGTPIANRNHPGLSQIIGMFVNTLALRNFPRGDVQIRDFFHQVKLSTLEAFQNQDYQFEDLVEKIVAERDMSRNPLFDVMFVFQNFVTSPMEESIQETGGFLISPYHYENTTSKFDLTLTSIEIADKLALSFEYCTKLFKKETILRYIGYFKQLVSWVTMYPEDKIATVELLTKEEKELYLYTFNQTEVLFPDYMDINKLFLEQTKKEPDKIVVLSSSDYMTFKSLHVYSDCIAGSLIKKGIFPGTIVGIMIERSIELIVGLLGIVKTRAAYLPIDPHYPKERISYMLDDSNAAVLLTSDLLKEFLKETVVKPEMQRKLTLPSPQEIMYIIYTSGTTGKPKGAGVYQRGFINLMYWFVHNFGLNANDRNLLITSLSFDLTQKNIFAPLITGGTLILPHLEYFDPAGILLDITEKRVTWINCTPGMMYKIIENGSETKMTGLASLRYVFLGGESITMKGLNNWVTSPNFHALIVNTYGPTECTDICASFQLLMPVSYTQESIPTGKPIYNARIYVLNRFLVPLPVGMVGELFIGGEGVGIGYINHPELTIEKFIHIKNDSDLNVYAFKSHSRLASNPFITASTIYRTGDLASWLPDGNVEILGRIDHQVKIRGFRIELAEIEDRLMHYNYIKEAVVIDKQDKKGDKYLAAYIVISHSIDTSEMRNYLSKSLPDYMIPSYFVTLDSIPLTPHGKVDKRALPEPVIEWKEVYHAPRNVVEKKLAEVLEKVLGRERIGIHENFFMSGGDSIKAIQVASRMRRAGYKLEIKDIFQNPTISTLSPMITLLKQKIEQDNVTGVVPLSPIQKEFFQYHEIAAHHFNHAVMLKGKEKISKEILVNVFKKLQEHHDALRIRFEMREEIVQIVNDANYPVEIEEHDLTGKEDISVLMESLCNRIQSGINLQKGPLMKIGLLHMDDGDRVLVVIHHLVVDGISWRILLEDIDTLYRQYTLGEKPVLPLKTSSFKEWSEKLKKYSQQNSFLLEKSYWRNLELHVVEELEKDCNEKEGNYVNDTSVASFSLNEGETERFLNNSNQAFGTEINDILLTALGMGLKKTFNKEKFIIALEGHGREELFEDVDISRTVGWFTGIYPVLLEMTYSHDMGRQIKEIKENLRKIPNKGIGYGILKYLTPGEFKEDLKFSLKPSISFNYLGQFGTDLRDLSFEVANEAVGNTESSIACRKYEFDINGMVVRNQLHMEMIYNHLYYNKETIKKMMENFKGELLRLIEYCSQKKIREYSPSDFTYKELPIVIVDELCNRYSIEDIYTLSPMQEGMLFHTLLEEHSSYYFEQISYRLHMELDIDAVQNSLKELFRNHDILRTFFIYKDVPRPIQVVLKKREPGFYYENISHLQSAEEKSEHIRTFKMTDIKKGFDLSHNVSMRVSILQLEYAEYEVIWSFHHIIMDGWCIGILNREFFLIYMSIIKGERVDLPEAKPYRDYIKWLETRDNEAARQYWKSYLENYEEISAIPRILINDNVETAYKKESVEYILEKEEIEQLKKMSELCGVTLSIIMQGIWGILLGMYNNREDVVFGVVVSGRSAEITGIESMVGLFINTLPVRVTYCNNTPFVELLVKLQAAAIESEPHQFYPLVDILGESSLKKDLIDHIFIFENYPVVEQFEEIGTQVNEGNNKESSLFNVSNVDVFEQTNYDFNITLGGRDRLILRFDYNGNIFTREFVEKIGLHIHQVVREIIENQNKIIKEIDFLSFAEKEQILLTFNDTKNDYPQDRTIWELFCEQVLKTPDYIAANGPTLSLKQKKIHKTISNSSSQVLHLSYRELHQRSIFSAHLLLGKGIESGNIVGLMVGRVVEMMVWMLGILNTGNAYLPIDPTYPQERIKYVLEDSRAQLLISDRSIAETDLGRIKVREMWAGKVFDEKDSKQIYSPSCSPIACKHPIAYVMYTSGSTGRPKGVIIEHRAVCNFFESMAVLIDFRVSKSILALTTISFDISGLEILLPICRGLRVVIADENHQQDIQLLDNLITKKCIDMLQATPTRMQMFILTGDERLCLANLKEIMVGGEELPQGVLRKLKQMTAAKIYNMYGPTETTIWSTVMDLTTADKIMVGKPILNTQIFILENNIKPVPIGIPGELYISGDGVARGYLNKPESTAEKFLLLRHKILTSGSFYRIYKTGDLSRWMPDGNIEFLGRIDRQIKIRGFRIEGGEIEAQLIAHPLIKDAVVLLRNENGEKYLCAYIVSIKGIPDTAEIIEFLSRSLPEYMIPSFIVPIDRIPLTTNGKIDKNALPLPEVVSTEKYVAPRNDIEKKLVNIWDDILGRKAQEKYNLLPPLGIDDHFFKLGGHSLKATIMVSRIHKEFHVKVPLIEIFRNPVIRGLSRYIETAIKITYSAIEKIEEKEYYPLSPAQKRLYLLYGMAPHSIGYNISAAVQLIGECQTQKLSESFTKLIQRHESLRTSFHMIDGNPVQRIHRDPDPMHFLVMLEAHSNESTSQIVTEFIKAFDLSRAPLLRLGLIKVENKKHILVLDMSHIISDGTSIGILVEEFLKLYRDVELPALSLQYKDFSHWQNSKRDNSISKLQEMYWLNEFYEEAPVLNLPIDFPRPVVQNLTGDVVEFEIDEGITKQLKQLALMNGTTIFMLMLAIVNILLYRLSNQEDIVVGTPVAGRVSTELERIIGMFVNTIALRNYPLGEKSFSNFLNEVKTKSLSAFENQEYPFEKLVEKLPIQRDTGRNPLFDVAIDVQNIDSSSDLLSLEMEGLKLEPYPFQRGISKFDLVFHFGENGDCIAVAIDYAVKLFREDSVRGFAQYLKKIIKQVIENIDVKIGEFDILSDAEKQEMISALNDNSRLSTYYNRQTTLQGMFNIQKEKTPHHIALTGPSIWLINQDSTRDSLEPSSLNIQITYKILNDLSNRLACLLRQKNGMSNKNSIIGIMMEPSLERIVVILAILKTGSAYLPLDNTYPPERIKYMLEDSGVKILLTTPDILADHSFTALQGLAVEDRETFVHKTAPRPQIVNLESIQPVDRTLVDYEKYNHYIGQAMVKHSIALQATRGCPYNCAYCHKIWPRNHVYRSAQNIFDELLQFYSCGIRRFVFIDDIFNINIENSKAFFQLVVDSGLDIQFFFPNGLRGDLLTHDYIDLMVKAGTVNVALALETASSRLQKLVGKNLNLERLKDNLTYFCEKYPQVILELFTMHGFPTETETEALQTLEFVKQFKWIHFPYVHILKIYPGTDMSIVAQKNGISTKAIEQSRNLAFHQLPETLPFDKQFTLKYQADFLNNYFLLKERLLHILPYQLKILSEDEIVQKYDSYLPVEIKTLDDLMEFTGISKAELESNGSIAANSIPEPGLNLRIKEVTHSLFESPLENALKVLLLDLSQFFSHDKKNMLYDVVEPPLGLMYLLTTLKRKFGRKVNGRIAKSRIDFDSHDDLHLLLDEFKPDVIGIRSLTYYSDFFHHTVAMIRQWGIQVPVIAGGPYATSEYASLLRDRNINLVVLGEGENTLCDIVAGMIENNGTFPSETELKQIPGIAYIPRFLIPSGMFGREIIPVDKLTFDFKSSASSALSYQMKEMTTETQIENSSTKAAYVIYTSGTTGKPKGVLIEHRNIASLMESCIPLYNYDYRDIWTMFHSYCFDFSVWEMYGALLFGGKLILVPRMVTRDPHRYLEILKREAVTILNQTPSVFYRLIEEETLNPQKYLRLRYVIFGGEALKPGKLKPWKEKYPGTSLINMYGITETTVHVTFKEITSQDIALGISSIGKPIASLFIRIVNQYLQMQVWNVAGELVVGGAGVGRGYLNQPGLTAEKFISINNKPLMFENDCISNKINKSDLRTAKARTKKDLFYRTGDLARHLTDGNIEYLGRIDSQVKIRGFRIELGEIEARLSEFEGVNEAVVITNGDEQTGYNLCAYIVPDKNDIDSSELTAFISAKLPYYMIPYCFIQLDKIPITSSGKIDYKKLPKPQQSLEDRTHTIPRNYIEKRLTGIWAEILGIAAENIGIEDNFFDLGGNSLSLVQLYSCIDKEFGVAIPIVSLYHEPIIKEISWWLLTKKAEAEHVVLLNSHGNRPIFGFPPQNGYSLFYLPLAQELRDYSFYGFSFIENMEPEDLIEKYVNTITTIQTQGPYVLCGYSAASELTAQVAKKLEAFSVHPVEIIFFDCFFSKDKSFLDDLEWKKANREHIDQYMDQTLKKFNATHLKQKVLQTIDSYMEYKKQITNLEKINANIYMIRSEEEIVDTSIVGWERITRGTYTVYKGFGGHSDLFGEDNLKKNIEIVKMILEGIFS